MSKIPQAYFDKVKGYFNGDINHTWTWFKSPNPNLGMVSPMQMIRVGRINKVVGLIDSLTEGHRP